MGANCGAVFVIAHCLLPLKTSVERYITYTLGIGEGFQCFSFDVIQVTEFLAGVKNA